MAIAAKRKRKSSITLGAKHTARVSARRIISDTVDSQISKKNPLNHIVKGAIGGLLMNLLK